MDNFDVAIALLREAQAEKNRLASMNAALESVEGWDRRYAIMRQYEPTPHKAVVNDNIKMVRRLLMRERL